MKEILSKIISALEDKAGSDLISMSGFKDAHMAQLNETGIGN